LQYVAVVRTLALLLTFAAAAAAVATARTSPGSQSKLCGGEERWGVKTLSDPRAARVHFSTPKRRTIHYLLTEKDPHVTASALRDADGSHVEVTVYHLVGVRLVDARIEQDGDIHLVIRSKYPGEHMIVEFPNAACKGARVSRHKAELEQARSDFATLCGLDAWATRKLRASPKNLGARPRSSESASSTSSIRRRSRAWPGTTSNCIRCSRSARRTAISPETWHHGVSRAGGPCSTPTGRRQSAAARPATAPKWVRRYAS
jgi:hypothetical protein